jgi:predicted DNA binding CopG/RHH family protein
MGVSKSIKREVVEDVFRRLMIEMNNPDSEINFEPLEDIYFEVDDVAAQLDVQVQEGHSGMYAATAKSTTTVAKPEPVCGTKSITIRIHNRVIRAFKAQAAATGTAYQTLMHRALSGAADGFIA